MIAPGESSAGVALFLVGVILLELGVDSLVVVVGAFLGVGVLGSMIGFGDGGGAQAAGVFPFLEHHVELRTDQGDDTL